MSSTQKKKTPTSTKATKKPIKKPQPLKVPFLTNTMDSSDDDDIIGFHRNGGAKNAEKYPEFNDSSSDYDDDNDDTTTTLASKKMKASTYHPRRGRVEAACVYVLRYPEQVQG